MTPEITKDNLPAIKAVLVEYIERSEEAFALETEMLKVMMAMFNKLEEVL